MRKKIKAKTIVAKVRMLDVDALVSMRVTKILQAERAEKAAVEKRAGNLAGIVSWLLRPHTCRAEMRGPSAKAFATRLDVATCDRCIAEADAARVLQSAKGGRR